MEEEIFQGYFVTEIYSSLVLRALVLVHLSPYNYYNYSIIILTLLLILACQKGKFIDSSIDRCIRQDFLLQLVFSLLVLLLPAK